MNSKNALLSSIGGRLGTAITLCALMTFPAVGQDREARDDDEPVQVTDYGTVTLAVQDTDLAQVLEMLSIQSQKNIITSRNVSATISANLYDVTFYEALDSILKVNGYDYIEEGNFIYIYTQAEMEELEALKRKSESRIFELNYLSASDANELIAPLLSETGRSSFRGDVQPGIEPDSSDAGQDNWAFTAMLVVNDFPDNLNEIASLLADLDVPPKQVLIESTILQSTLNEANAFGIDFSAVASVDFTNFTNPLNGVTDLVTGALKPADNNAFNANTSVGNTSEGGGLKIGIIRDDLAVFLRVLDQVTDTTVLARPKIMCLNRQRAEVLVGRRVGYLSTTATETSSTQTVEFLDTGIHLMFRPFIARDGMIRLELAPSVSDFVLREVAGSGTTRVTIPDEVTNELTTNVRVKDGQTLVLGGLFRESNQVKRRQVPVLGDIPLVGAAFRGQDDEVKLEEIIFLITPSVVHDEVLWAMGDSAVGFSDAILVGSRQGLLPWSQQKTTASHNARALEAFNEGDLNQALYHVNNSLRVSPNQPEMIRLRDRINGFREQPFERGLLEKLIRKELGGGTSSVSAPATTPGGGEYVIESVDEPGTTDEPVAGENVPELPEIVVEATGPISSATSTGDEVPGPMNSGVSTPVESPQENALPAQTFAANEPSNEPSNESTSTVPPAFEEDVETAAVPDSDDWLDSMNEEPAQVATTAETIKTAGVNALSGWGNANVSEIEAGGFGRAETSDWDETGNAGFQEDPKTAAPVDEPAMFGAGNDRADAGFQEDPKSGAPVDEPANVEVAEVVPAGPATEPVVPAVFPAPPPVTGPLNTVSTYPELKVDYNPAVEPAPTSARAAAAATPTVEVARDQLVDRLVNDYFSSLGLSHLSPYRPREDDENQNDEQFASPFVTFEDMFDLEVVEAGADEKRPE